MSKGDKIKGGKNKAAKGALEFLTKKAAASLPEWAKKISFDEYLSMKRVSSHLMMDFSKSPRLFKKRWDGLIPDVDKKCYKDGRAVHAMILEGREYFDKQFSTACPINEKTGKPYGATTKKTKEEEKKIGKELIDENTFAILSEMEIAVDNNEFAKSVLSGGAAEVSVFTKIGNI